MFLGFRDAAFRVSGEQGKLTPGAPRVWGHGRAVRRAVRDTERVWGLGFGVPKPYD